MSDNNITIQAIDAANKGVVSFSKFITANDTPVNGSHQSGFYLHKNSYALFLENIPERGENLKIPIIIKWQGNFETESMFTYYGKAKNEYRLTKFGKDFPFLTEENIGSLLVITKQEDGYYNAFVLSTDDEIEDFMNAVGISTEQTNQIIPKTNKVDIENKVKEFFDDYINSLKVDFPLTTEIADKAREIIMGIHNISSQDIKSNPDKEILRWIDSETQLFKSLENSRYSEITIKPFANIEDFIKTANTVLNRRKSRAGKSLEHHLSKMFNIFELKFSEQPHTKTEGNKRPDFIFPGIEEYHNFIFDEKKLIFLASKTTCKDRWRQILNEADRIKIKHLFTLQHGISPNQLDEMNNENVQLVVPEKYISDYPNEYKKQIMPLSKFIAFVSSSQN